MIDSGVTREEVPPGYQRTEVGVIPEDWDIKTFNDVTLKIQDGTHFSPRLGGNDYLYVTSRNIGPGKLDVSDVERISKEEHRKIYARCDTKKGDLLLTKDGVNTGNAAINTLNEECSLLSSVAFLRFDMERHDPRFYLYFILSDEGQKQIKSLMSGNAITRLTLQKIRRLIIPVPLLPEQRAIATALSDVGELIGALDALIEKKRAIKQAAMQQLLTGKTRLPGFSSEWETKRLGDVGVFSKGRGIKRDDVSDGGVPCIRYGELYTRYYNYVTTPVSRIPMTVAQTALPIKTGDLLFAGSGETAEDIGRCAAYLGDEQAYVGGDIIVLTPSGQNSMYLGYLMNCSSVAAQKARLGQGDAVVHISATNLARVEINLPPIDEQRAIATFLSDMDTEIAALERRREKAEQIKQGMMQQLLTGRIRLVEPPGTAA